MNLDDLNIIDDDDLITGEDQEAHANNEIGQDLDITLIYPNPDQPRKYFDEEKLKELSITIKKHGLLQAITVLKDENNKYMIVAGERRYRAHLLNNAKTIKAIVNSKISENIDEAALIENIQRDDLTPFETATSIKKIWESGKYKSKGELAVAIGKKPSYLSKAFAIFNCSDDILKDIEENSRNIGLDVLQELSRSTGEELQLNYYKGYLDGNYTRQDIRSFIKNNIQSEERKKEKLNEVDYSKKVQEEINSGCNVSWNHERVTYNDNSEHEFENEIDSKKIKEWKEEYTTNQEIKEKEELKKEKLNNEDYAALVKDEIFNDAYFYSDSEIRFKDWKYHKFGNEKDIKQINDWKKEFEEKEEKNNTSLNDEIRIIDCEVMDIVKLINEVIRIDQLIINKHCSSDDKYIVAATKILEKRLNDEKIDISDIQIEKKLIDMSKDDYELSSNKNFIYDETMEEVYFFSNDNEKNFFLSAQSKYKMRDIIYDANNGDSETIEHKNDNFVVSNLSEMGNHMILTFNKSLVPGTKHDELLKELEKLREKFEDRLYTNCTL